MSDIASSLGRRDFLRVAGMLPLGLGLSPLVGSAEQAEDSRPNVLIIVFDAFSAYHIPSLGYARQTTPNLTRLAERAIVYHNHYAPGTFTSPGTGSLLTGTMPWTHRAFNFNGWITEERVPNNIFAAFADHFRVACTHNPFALTILKQFARHIDRLVDRRDLFLTVDPLIPELFGADEDVASVSFRRAIKKEEGYSYSLLLSSLYKRFEPAQISRIAAGFPRGIPNVAGDNLFLLEDATNWLRGQVTQWPRPYLAYAHFLPPHAPYNAPSEFVGAFEGDGFLPPDKPRHILAIGDPDLPRLRTEYDEYILYADRELGRIFEFLDVAGELDRTWVILTSDHGELFERGVQGHTSALVYEPGIRIPLLVFEPGRTSRLDIHTRTSAIDMLPTLLHVTGQPPVNWAEGNLLPPFGPEDPSRPIISLYAEGNPANDAIKRVSIMQVQGDYKLQYYAGFQQLGNDAERVELYDLRADPHELQNLYPREREVGDAMLAALKDELLQANEPYL